MQGRVPEGASRLLTHVITQEGGNGNPQSDSKTVSGRLFFVKMDYLARFCRRWRTISYARTPAATDAFSESS